MAMKLGEPTTLRSGPWRGVLTTKDPYDQAEDLLYDAVNMILPDPSRAGGMYSRGGFVLGTGATMGSKNTATGWLHIMRDGTKYNFVIQDGKVFRVAADSSARTDVTPVGVTIDSGTDVRVYMQSYNDTLIVSDGVNRPWYGTNLGATPITGTYIQMTTAAGAWTAFGQPTIFSGVLVFIVKSPAAGAASKARVAITWCEPGDQTLGYEQTGYTDFANIIQTSSRQLFAILGTNNGLYYWRDTEIGIAQGIADGSFASTATYAAVSTNIGCVAPATVLRYQDTIYFCDQLGRPQRLPIGGSVQEPQMWLQMREVVEGAVDDYANLQAVLEYRAVAGIDPLSNVYVVAPYPSSQTLLPTVAYAFDAKTGTYVGRWLMGVSTVLNGVYIKGFGPFNNSVGLGADCLCLLSGSTSGGTDTVYGVLASPAANLRDTGYTSANTRAIITNPLGYQANVVYNCGQTLSAVTTGTDDVTFTTTTPYGANTAAGGLRTPNSSSDNTYRVVVGTDIPAARGITVTVTASTGGTPNWGVQRVELIAVPSLAGPEDQ